MSKKLIYNGTVLTMDATNQIFKPGYVYLEHDIIVEAGSMERTDGSMDHLNVTS